MEACFEILGTSQVDLGTIPSPLIHSKLFGCKKGAFTGAEERKGLVRTAHGGTLFLDGIGDAPLEVQPCLLQMVEAKALGTRWESASLPRSLPAMFPSPCF